MIKKWKAMILGQLTQGATPEGLALSCAFGVIVGNFPLFGLTTVLGFLLGLAFKLNQPALQASNYLMAPSQIVAIPLLLYLGETIVGAPHVSLNPKVIVGEFFTDIPLFFSHYGMAALEAILAWTLIAPVVLFVVYHILKGFFRTLQKQFKRGST